MKVSRSLRCFLVQVGAKTTMSRALAAGLALLFLSRRTTAMSCSTSTLSVPSVVEDTAGALQLSEALKCSSGVFDVEWVGSVTAEETIDVADGTTLSISGEADGSSIVNGDGKISLFEVDGGTLILSGLSVTNGTESYGGALYATDSTLKADNCTFSDNFASDYGGAMYLSSSTLEATGSTFAGNFANSSGGIIMAFDSILTTENCTFSGSTAERYGGVVYLGSSSELEATDSTFIGNSASDQGGAIHARQESVVTLNHCTLSNNYADSSGGAVYLDNSTLELAHSDFAGNKVDLYGGAIYVGDSLLAADECTFTDNNATVLGGAIYVYAAVVILDSCTFVNNTARSGGGINAKDSIVNVTESNFAGNFVT